MKRLLYIITALLLVNSCGQWLDVQPYDKISESQLFSSEDGYMELLNGIYIELNSTAMYGSSLQVEMLEIMGGAYEIGDESIVWGHYTDLKNYNYQTEYWRGKLNLVWNKAYSLILNCNKILDNIDAHKDVFSSDRYDIVKGEALALRGMLHFDMLRLFGPIYSESPDAKSIPYFESVSLVPHPLLPASEVMTLVLKDLTEAYRLLVVDPVISEGTLMSASGDGDDSMRYRQLRLNYYAVAGLLARTHLYAGDKPQAFKYAQEVIRAADMGIFPFVSRDRVIGTSDPDRIFSTELLFALSHSSRNQIFLNYFSPTRTTFSFKMENSLLTSVIFGGGVLTGGYQDDYRNRVCWSSSGTNRFFYKYSDQENPSVVENTMIPMIRLGEMYLIAAEAQSENLAAGASYVNALRRHRGISVSLGSLDRDQLIREYIRELYGEGQLFYMYKRLNADIIRSSVENKNVKAGANVFVVPLPDTETENQL